jgi:hemolysin III
VAIWGVALFGVLRELRSSSHEPPALWLYMALGWLSVAAAANLAAHLEATVLALLVAGAALYTVGAIFYVNTAGYRHAHAAWHLFVLAGTTTHYVAVERVLV